MPTVDLSKLKCGDEVIVETKAAQTFELVADGQGTFHVSFIMDAKDARDYLKRANDCDVPYRVSVLHQNSGPLDSLLEAGDRLHLDPNTRIFSTTTDVTAVTLNGLEISSLPRKLEKRRGVSCILMALGALLYLVSMIVRQDVVVDRFEAIMAILAALVLFLFSLNRLDHYAWSMRPRRLPRKIKGGP